MRASFIALANASAARAAAAAPVQGVKLEAFRFFGTPLISLPSLASKTPDIVTTLSTINIPSTTSAWPALAAFPAPLRPRFDGAAFTS